MPDLVAERRLVKSPPELWAEVSEVERLAQHLGAFGEIRITKLQPESSVDWEGEHAHGTVSIEPSGWGRKVILKAPLPELPAPEPPAPQPEPEPEPPTLEHVVPELPSPADEAFAELFRDPEPEPPAPPPAPRRGFFSRWLYRSRRQEEAQPEPVAVEPPPPPPPPEP